jgi:outer membrane protein assembly factor BamB
MNRTRKVLLSGLLTMASSLAHAQSVKLAPAAAHPEAAVAVSGAHFADSEAIDVYVDAVDTLLVVSTSTGTFSGTVTVPAAAGPGKHYITAIGRRSGAAAQGALTVTTPWVEYGFGAKHLGWNPYENTIDSDNVAQLGLLWSTPVNGAAGTTAVSGGKAFAGTFAGITALSTTTGALLWTAATSDIFLASPAVAAGVVYAAGYSGTVYALNAGTGTQIWSVALGGGSISSPVVVAGVVYVAVSGAVYALQASTGNTLWSSNAIGAVYSPAVANGTLYTACLVNDDYSGVCALNAATGALEWTSQQAAGAISGSPSVSGGFVYVATVNGAVYAISTTREAPGYFVWSYFMSPGEYEVGATAVAYGNVYIVSNTGALYALDAKFGTLTWYDDELNYWNQAIGLANGVLYVTDSERTLCALDVYFGGVLARWDTDIGGVAISDGVVYVSGASLTALSPLADTNVVRSEPRAPEISTLHPDLTLEVR